MTHAADNLDDYLNALDHALDRELADGCTDDTLRRGVGLDARTTFAAHRAAVELVREIRENPDLRVWFVTTRRRSLDDTRLTDIYADEDGNEHWFDHATERLIHVDPQTVRHSATPQYRPSTQRTDVRPIREKAVSLLTRLIPTFYDRLPELHPYENNIAGREFHFRWDDYSEPLADNEDPPHVHIALDYSGRFRMFRNALR